MPKVVIRLRTHGYLRDYCRSFTSFQTIHTSPLLSKVSNTILRSPSSFNKYLFRSKIYQIMFLLHFTPLQQSHHVSGDDAKLDEYHVIIGNSLLQQTTKNWIDTYWIGKYLRLFLEFSEGKTKKPFDNR